MSQSGLKVKVELSTDGTTFNVIPIMTFDGSLTKTTQSNKELNATHNWDAIITRLRSQTYSMSGNIPKSTHTDYAGFNMIYTQEYASGFPESVYHFKITPDNTETSKTFTGKCILSELSDRASAEEYTFSFNFTCTDAVTKNG